MPCFSEVSEVSEPSSWGRSFSFEEASDFGRGAGGWWVRGGAVTTTCSTVLMF